MANGETSNSNGSVQIKGGTQTYVSMRCIKASTYKLTLDNNNQPFNKLITQVQCLLLWQTRYNWNLLTFSTVVIDLEKQSKSPKIELATKEMIYTLNIRSTW